MTELAEFHQHLIADVQSDADVFGLVAVEAFFDQVGELLSEAGETDSAHRAYYEGTYARSNLQLDGYGGDPRESEGILTLILCDFVMGDEIRIINKDGMQRLQQRLQNFLEVSLKSEFRFELEETSAGYGVADLIATTWSGVEKIKLIVVTNGEYRTRTDAAVIQEMDGKPVTLSVWDLRRLMQYAEQGQARDNLLIDFENEFGGGLPLLKASGSSESLESYLVVVPGKQLATIYDKWGPRLLESNVRSFLQARSITNRGIRDTIRDEPHMFFPYNNGISATADAVDIERSDSGLKLATAKNLQIVNGGQTTASVHAALKTASEQLADVFVQMKLTIVPAAMTESVVPKISEYANTQNKVNAADFFSNHPFHVRIEEHSRRVLAPAGEGYRETKWFYERARGQYADERGRRTKAERKKFDAEFPRPQFITKTDLAKFENTWSCLPHTVSLGAQKNFAHFAKGIGTRWGGDGAKFDQLWFRRMIAKAIIFRRTEKLVSASEWYEGGFRANIVTYSIAKVVHDATQKKRLVDLDLVWRSQCVSAELVAALTLSAIEAQAVLTSPAEGIRNITEWAKKQACWQRLSDKKLSYDRKFTKVLISPDVADDTARAAKKEDAVDESVQTQIEVHKLGAAFWAEAGNWSKEKGVLGHRDLGVISTCAAIPHKLPSERQCVIAMAALEKLYEAGFRAQE